MASRAARYLLWALAVCLGVPPGCALGIYRLTLPPRVPDENPQNVVDRDIGFLFPLNAKDLAELCDRDPASFDGNSILATADWGDCTMSADCIVYYGYDRPAETHAWSSARLADGTACVARYGVRISTHPDTSGGWAGGSGFVGPAVEGVHLMERLRPPPSTPGWVGIKPGEFVVVGPEKASPRRFLIDLPAARDIQIKVLQWAGHTGRGDVSISVTDGDQVLPFHLMDSDGSVATHVRIAGTYRIIVTERQPMQAPIVINVTWGWHKRGWDGASTDDGITFPAPKPQGPPVVRNVRPRKPVSQNASTGSTRSR